MTMNEEEPSDENQRLPRLRGRIKRIAKLAESAMHRASGPSPRVWGKWLDPLKLVHSGWDLWKVRPISHVAIPIGNKANGFVLRNHTNNGLRHGCCEPVSGAMACA